MTHPATPVLTQSSLKNVREHILLQLWCVLYEIERPTENARKALSALTGISESGLKNFLSGKGSIGGLAWLTIQKEIQTPLYEMWLEANQ